MSLMSHDCDLLVIGSGAGGLSAAVTAAHLGLKVIVAEYSGSSAVTEAKSLMKKLQRS